MIRFFCFAVLYFHPWRWYCRLCNIGLVWCVCNLRGFGRSRGPANGMFRRVRPMAGRWSSRLYAKSVLHRCREDVFVRFLMLRLLQGCCSPLVWFAWFVVSFRRSSRRCCTSRSCWVRKSSGLLKFFGLYDLRCFATLGDCTVSSWDWFLSSSCWYHTPSACVSRKPVTSLAVRPAHPVVFVVRSLDSLSSDCLLIYGSMGLDSQLETVEIAMARCCVLLGLFFVWPFLVIRCIDFGTGYIPYPSVPKISERSLRPICLRLVATPRTIVPSHLLQWRKTF